MGGGRIGFQRTRRDNTVGVGKGFNCCRAGGGSIEIGGTSARLRLGELGATVIARDGGKIEMEGLGGWSSGGLGKLQHLDDIYLWATEWHSW